MKKIFSIFVVLLFVASSVSIAAEVKVVENEYGWQLLVDNSPFVVKGVYYTPTMLGESLFDNSRRHWMHVDDDDDGRNDFAYQTWVDFNKNNERETKEEEIGDFELLKKMGCNVIRFGHHPSANPEIQELNMHESTFLNQAPNKELLRELHSKYGIWVVIEDFLGAYRYGSGTRRSLWVDYMSDYERANMLKSVEDMVNEHKDEPYLLMWVLGNGNDSFNSSWTTANKYPIVYAEFVNKAVKRIKELDGKHPVCLVVSSTEQLEILKEYAPAIDIIGLKSEPDKFAFGSIWGEIASKNNKPVLLMEIGVDHPKFGEYEIDEKYQADLHRSYWNDIFGHMINKEKPGNAIGGFAFEWVDEWWRHGKSTQRGYAQWFEMHDEHNEYSGIASLGFGHQGALMRQLREVYFMYKKIWNE